MLGFVFSSPEAGFHFLCETLKRTLTLCNGHRNCGYISQKLCRSLVTRMESSLVFACIILSGVVYGTSYDPLKIHQPSIDLATELTGFVGLHSGADGDVKVQLKNDNGTGSIYFDGEDLLYIIQIIESEPPFWKHRGPNYADTPYGYLGNFRAGNVFRVILTAVDPEGMPVTYSLVAGNLPPGIKLDPASGELSGIVPDADATYTFTMRATDVHMKYADNVFKMVVRGYDRCVDKTTCRHEGVCHDTPGGFTCTCLRPYGGKQCADDCRWARLGISNDLRTVSDAQITGYHMHSSNGTSQGRLGGANGWTGIDHTSYMQVDFGDKYEIYRIATEYVNSSLYVSSFYIQYSIDGNNFSNFTDYAGKLLTFAGATTVRTVPQTFPEVLMARYVRLFPLDWDRNNFPAFRVEMYGCHGN